MDSGALRRFIQIALSAPLAIAGCGNVLGADFSHGRAIATDSAESTGGEQSPHGNGPSGSSGDAGGSTPTCDARSDCGTPPKNDAHAPTPEPTKLLLIGSATVNAPADVWTFDGSAWTEATGTRPIARSYAAAGMLNGAVILTGGYDGSNALADTWRFAYGTWTDKTTAADPGARYEATMASANGTLMLFGGWNDSEYVADTWQLDSAGWKKLAPSTSPSARSACAVAAFDSEVVMFGGLAPADAGDDVMDETWTWNGTTWKARSPANVPPARSYAAMARLGNRMVMFGGRNGSALGDTWEWNGTDWKELSPVTAPAARAGACMATLGDTIVLYGGSSGGDQTWTFDGTDWTQLSVAGPPGLDGCSLVPIP